MTPVRLQLSRKKGFDLQKVSREANGLAAYNVARPSEFGNRFKVERGTILNGPRAGSNVWMIDRQATSHHFTARGEALEAAVRMFRAWIGEPPQERFRARAQLTLKGKNLACWCKPGAPCHADVLLELVNA